MECVKLFETSINVNGSVTFYLQISIYLILFSVCFYFLNRMKRKNRMGYLAPIFMLFIFLAFFVANFFEYLEFAEVLEKGRYRISCGVVSVLQREPPSGLPRDDIIKVGKSKFVIGGGEVTSAYNKTNEIGGVLDDGVKVRLAHYNGRILRVEVCSELPDPCSSKTE